VCVNDEHNLHFLSLALFISCFIPITLHLLWLKISNFHRCSFWESLLRTQWTIRNIKMLKRWGNIFETFLMLFLIHMTIKRRRSNAKSVFFLVFLWTESILFISPSLLALLVSFSMLNGALKTCACDFNCATKGKI
jgi:hypothetical protein